VALKILGLDVQEEAPLESDTGRAQAHGDAGQGHQNARILSEIIAAVGLAQNLAALRALVTTGIQNGHMRLHARQMAAAAGAKGDAVEHIAGQMVAEGNIRVERAKELLRG
jgi:hydroxymethylglutaryl-CoA reductase